MLAHTLRSMRLGLRRLPFFQALLQKTGVSTLGRRIYECLLLRQGDTTAVIMGQTLKLCTSSGRVIMRIDSFCEEEAFVARLLGSLREDDVLLDVGANIGLISLVIAKARPNVRIHAFEPEPRNAAELRKNIELNHLTDRITVHAVALGAADGIAPLYVEGESGDGSHTLLSTAGGGRKAIEITVRQAESWCLAHQITPNVIKIDVEGAEGLVLQGMQAMLARGTVRDIFIEWHPHALKALQLSEEQIADLYLKPHYSRCWSLQRGGQNHAHYTRGFSSEF